MLYAMVTLVGLQLVGDLFAEEIGIQVPGMIVGLALLFGIMWVRGQVLGLEHAIPQALEGVAKTLHGNFGLLFVPAGAGVGANAASLMADGVGLITAVIVSTIAAILVTAITAGWGRTEISAQARADAG